MVWYDVASLRPQAAKEDDYRKVGFSKDRSIEGIEYLVVAADAGMLLARNLKALDDAGYQFIGGGKPALNQKPWTVPAKFAG